MGALCRRFLLILTYRSFRLPCLAAALAHTYALSGCCYALIIDLVPRGLPTWPSTVVEIKRTRPSEYIGRLSRRSNQWSTRNKVIEWPRCRLPHLMALRREAGNRRHRQAESQRTYAYCDSCWHFHGTFLSCNGIYAFRITSAPANSSNNVMWNAFLCMRFCIGKLICINDKRRSAVRRVCLKNGARPAFTDQTVSPIGCDNPVLAFHRL